mgnify:CR=1 FL=1
MDELSLITAFMLGLLGSSHCLGMCGGISAALGMSNQSTTKVQQLGRLIAYNGGRISTYGLIGALAGFIGSQLTIVPEVGIILRGIAGLLLIAMGLYVAGWWFGLTKIEQLGAKLWRHIQPLTRSLLPITGPSQALKLGLLWGLLPCGLVYSTLSWALAAADWQHSALLMIFFGLGTSPAMLATGFASQQVLSLLKKRGARMLAGSLIIAMGAVTLWTPISHLGHSRMQSQPAPQAIEATEHQHMHHH